MPVITRSMAKKMGKRPNTPAVAAAANTVPKTRKAKKSVKTNTVPRKRTEWDDYVAKTREFVSKMPQDGHHSVNALQVAKELQRLGIEYATMTYKDVEKAVHNLWGKHGYKYLNKTRITGISGVKMSPKNDSPNLVRIPKKSIFATIRNKFTKRNKYSKLE
jgi:hypothetical protein